MLSQLRRLWNDDGRSDKDFSSEEMLLKAALNDLKDGADQLSRASTALLDILHAKA